MLCALQGSFFVQGLQNHGDFSHRVPVAHSPVPKLMPCFNEIDNSVLGSPGLSEGPYDLQAIERGPSAGGKEQHVGESHLGNSEEAAPSDIRVSLMGNLHVLSVSMPNQRSHFVLKLLHTLCLGASNIESLLVWQCWVGSEGLDERGACCEFFHFEGEIGPE
jgi:hypothetical protein